MTFRPKMAAALLLAIPADAAGGTAGLYPVPLYDVAPLYSVNSLAMADLDEDDLPDVVVAGPFDHLAILMGRPGRIFGPASPLPVGAGQVAVSVSDLNGDGHEDLAVSIDPGDVAILLGHGDGDFAPARRFATGVFAADNLVADFDRDGRRDVAVLGSGGVTVLAGDGSGGLGPPAFHPLAPAVRDFAAGDFNGDAAPDLAVATAGPSAVMVLLNDGNGGFAPPLSYAAGSSPQSIVTGDFNRDGRLDLAVSSNTPSFPEVSVLPGRGDGTFAARLSSNAFGTTPGHLAAGDLDSDGILDLAVAVSTGINGLLGNGDGTFRLGGATAGREALFLLAELTDDARLDLLGAPSSGPAALMLRAGAGNGTFRVNVLTRSGFELEAIVPHDFNGDGALDVAAALCTDCFTSTAQAAVFLGRGNSTFDPPILVGTGHGSDFVTAIDVDGDGNVDLLIASRARKSVTLVRGTGLGTFQGETALPLPGGPAHLAAGDLDGDQRPDLVVVVPGSDRLEVLLNRSQPGLPGFTAGVPIAVRDFPRTAMLSDLDEDGRLDLLATGEIGTSILIGRGDGTFQPESRFEDGTTGSAAVADFNGDGHADLVLARGWYPPSVSLRPGIGDGTFGDPVTVADGLFFEAMRTADVNGDGRLDLIGARSGTFGPTAGAFVLLGLGDGRFTEPAGFLSAGRTLDLGDFNGDARPDLIAFEWTDLVLLLNQGPADTDGDGRDDPADNCLLAANPGQEDSDGDAAGDACDLCPSLSDPLQRDRDKDGIGDLCDPCTDSDGDGAGDPGFASSCMIDNCPAAANPLQQDGDGDGPGDPCDNCPSAPNPGQEDGDGDGNGDACPPIAFSVLDVRVRDLDGDADAFADPGETVRLSVTLLNSGRRGLSGVVLRLASQGGVSCITRTTIALGALPEGAAIDTALLGDPDGWFEFVTDPLVQTLDPGRPAQAALLLTLVANEAAGVVGPVSLGLPLDLDAAAAAAPLRVPGPDGLPATSDDGLLLENFDTDRDGDGQVTLASRPAGAPGVLNDTIGFWAGTGPGGGLTLAGIGCGGFLVPPEDPGCLIDPDHDMDWHIHCPAGECPNLPGHVTPTDGALAFDGRNSLHWGHHFEDTREGDSTNFRQLAAFVTAPVNLTITPMKGDLELSFFHIAAMMDNNEYGLPPGQANDFGDVQIQIDRDPLPGADHEDWGFWDKLVPFENVHDHIAYVWSAFGTAPTYCLLTPTDTGTGAPAPRGVHETMCHPQGVWSRCGDAHTRFSTYQCPGPGIPGETNFKSLWVQSRFDLADFAGQRVRIRWIGQSWEFDQTSYSYHELGESWHSQGDDGWWVDQIQIAGAVREQFTPWIDAGAAAGGACPAAACDATVADGGTSAVLAATDLEGRPIDGVAGIAIAGRPLRLSAAGSTLPGGCADGTPEFRFFRDGIPAADWSPQAWLEDTPRRDTVYGAHLRCSSETACASRTGAAITVLVYPGDGSDIHLTLQHDPQTDTTRVSWPSRPQVAEVSGYDLYRGTIAASGDQALQDLSGIACLAADVPQPAGSPGPIISVAVSQEPASGQVSYFLAGHNPVAIGDRAALGLRSDGTLRPLPPPCP